MITIDSYPDLIILHKTIMEAKFSGDVWDYDVPRSSEIAALSRKVVTELIRQADQKYPGQKRVEQWDSWLQIDPERREWKSALNFARKAQYNKLAAASLKAAVEDLLAPFTVSEDLVQQFVDELNHPE